MLVIEEIRLSIAGKLGIDYTADPNKIIFDVVKSGSVQCNGRISVDSSQNSANVYTTASSITASSGWGQYSLVSSSYTTNG
jgi:hypothetical protein